MTRSILRVNMYQYYSNHYFRANFYFSDTLKVIYNLVLTFEQFFQFDIKSANVFKIMTVIHRILHNFILFYFILIRNSEKYFNQKIPCV